jgi:hypothetical protein
MSLFSVISAVAIGDTVESDAPEWLRDVVPDHEEGDDDSFLVDLPPLPGASATAPPGAPSKLESRRRLRTANAEYAKALVQLTGLGHAHINAELNRMSGVERIAEATHEQLERRLKLAERWLQSG